MPGIPSLAYCLHDPAQDFFLEEKWKINGLSNTFYFNLLFARVEILVITYVPSQTLSLFVEL